MINKQKLNEYSSKLMAEERDTFVPMRIYRTMLNDVETWGELQTFITMVQDTLINMAKMNRIIDQHNGFYDILSVFSTRVAWEILEENRTTSSPTVKGATARILKVCDTQISEYERLTRCAKK